MKIRLSQNYSTGHIGGRILIAIVGILLIVQSFIHLASRPINYDILFFLDLAILLGGTWCLILGIFILSGRSKFAPRVEIDENEVLIHNHTFGQTHHIHLDNITRILFGSYELTFVEKAGGQHTYRINTRKSGESVKVKENLRRIAHNKNIEIEDEISKMMKNK